MSVEWSSAVRSRARVYAALGEPARLAIMDRLLLGDASPSELGRDLAVPGNLLAHHLNLLDKAGLIERPRSEGDHRRTYLRLRTPTPAGLQPTESRSAARLVFVCADNSARSPLAAALWARHSPVPAVCAGIHPVSHIHALAKTVARDHGLSLTRARTAQLQDVLHADDLIVAVCDNAHGELHTHTGERLHWSVPDPARVGTHEAYERAFRDIAERINRLAPTIQPHDPNGTVSS